jgi:hypothetical protein
MHRNFIAISLILLVVSLLTTPVLVAGETPTPTPDPSIQFGEITVTNDLPQGYNFEVTVTSTDFTPVSGTITFYFSEDWEFPSRLAIDPENPGKLSYYLNAISQDIFPFTPFEVEWTVKDSQGRTATTGRQVVSGYDPRFNWEKMESEKWDITIYIHNSNPSFKNLIFDTAERSAKFMEQDFNLHLTKPIIVVIYNSDSEVQDYYIDFTENTGGLAIPDIGLTIQIISDGYGVEDWINDVLPHEISHLYFHQATEGKPAPSWLNEGLAQVNEFWMDPDYVAYINESLKEAQPLPNLRRLESNFNSEQWSAQDYDMAYSITSYIIEAYGKESIHAILMKYADGTGREKAFKDVLGIDFDTLYDNWFAVSILGQDVSTLPINTPVLPATPTSEVETTINTDTNIVVKSSLLLLGTCGFLMLIAITILVIVLIHYNKKRASKPADPKNENTLPPVS